jgi:hypothetical protein
MLVDCHTHAYEYPAHVSDEFLADHRRAWGDSTTLLRAKPEDHFSAMRSVDRVIVLGFQGKRVGHYVPNDFVAAYARKHTEKVIGFASVDPNDPSAEKELRRCIRELGLKGLKLGPIYQHFDPTSRKAMRIFRLADKLEIPVIIHQGTTFVRNAPLKYANPILLEDVALRFPNLKMVIAHLGHPWEDETAVLVRKQPNIFTDISALHTRPFRLHSKLMTFQEYGVINKIIFGSDYPSFTPDETLQGIENVNKFAREHMLPTISESAIRAIIYENYANVLGSVF